MEQCETVRWNSVVQQCEQCGGTVGWNSKPVWWNSVERYGGTVEQCGRTVEQCGTVWWNSVVEQCCETV